MANRLLLLLPLLLAATSCGGVADSSSISGSSSDDPPPAACAAVDSLARLSEFFSRVSSTSPSALNADSYFGLSVASMALHSAPASSLAATVAGCSGGGGGGRVELTLTLARIDRVLASFRAAVHALSRNYNGRTYRTICRPLEGILRRRAWFRSGGFRWRRLNVSESGGGSGGSGGESWLTRDRILALINYDEDTGDACLKDALAAEEGRCQLPRPTCRHYFLSSRPTYGYTLTHQLIYWLAIVENSCSMKLSNGRSVDQSLLRDACSRMFREHRSILRANSNVRTILLDLMVEQAVLCSGFLGYRDFLADSTTLLLRRLQSERVGCFRDAAPEPIDVPAVSTGRRLMRDVILEDKCSTHTSGLAVAYLALFLHT